MLELDCKPEYLLLEVTLNKSKMTICIIYRAPTARLLSTIEEALVIYFVAYGDVDGLVDSNCDFNKKIDRNKR